MGEFRDNRVRVGKRVGDGQQDLVGWTEKRLQVGVHLGVGRWRRGTAVAQVHRVGIVPSGVRTRHLPSVLVKVILWAVAEVTFGSVRRRFHHGPYGTSTTVRTKYG